MIIDNEHVYCTLIVWTVDVILCSIVWTAHVHVQSILLLYNVYMYVLCASLSLVLRPLPGFQ